MKTPTTPAPAQPKSLPPLQRPRQLNIPFQTPALQGLTAERRTTAIQALTAVLLQAAGVHLAEDDDDER